jgi:hypothetical protein
MQKLIFFCFTFCLLIIQNSLVKAQQEFGQFVINAGVAYSPEFDGAWAYNGDLFPVGLYPLIDEEDGFFSCTLNKPNLGSTIDFGISNKCSLGIASNYQNETVNWSPSNQIISNYSDNITRFNVALRFLYHLNTENKHFDPYIGIRSGISIWHDSPSSNNFTGSSIIPITFIIHPNSIVPSFQVLYGMRFYLNHFIGIHIEVAVGSPYLIEGGLTFRINTIKAKEKIK